MGLIDWINLLAVTAAAISAVIAWHAKIQAQRSARESNNINKRLVELEEERDKLFDQIEFTPNLSSTKIDLRAQSNLFALHVNFANLSKHTIHVVAVSVYDAESGDLLGLAGQSKVVLSSEQIDTDFGARTTVIHKKVPTETGCGFLTTNRTAASLLERASEVNLYFRYSSTGDNLYSVSYSLSKVDPVMLQESLPNETQIVRGLKNLEEVYGQATKDMERRGQRGYCFVGSTWRGQHG